MCYIFNCFGWVLDLIQRIITFFLACWVAAAVCCGLIIVTLAGIAYGYNYSLAEFLTFTRSDVTVYMRRGQFYDRPDVVRSSNNFRRLGDADIVDDDELSEHNGSATHFEQHKQQIRDDDAAPLADSWQKAQDTRKYAERLVKYESTVKPRVTKIFITPEVADKEQNLRKSGQWVKYEKETESQEEVTERSQPHGRHKIEDTQKYVDMVRKFGSSHRPQEMGDESVEADVQTTLWLPTNPRVYHKVTKDSDFDSNLISMSPDIVMSTDIYRSGSSEIIMRNFEPIDEIVPSRSTAGVDDYVDYSNKMGIGEDPDISLKYLPAVHRQHQSTPEAILKRRLDGKPLSTPNKDITMRHWDASTTSLYKNFPAEDSYGEMTYKTD